MTYGGFKFQKALGVMSCKGEAKKALGVMSCKGEAKKQLKLKESILRLHAQAIANMVASTLRKTTIMEEQNIMNLFIVPDFEFVSKEVNECFVF